MTDICFPQEPYFHDELADGRRKVVHTLKRLKTLTEQQTHWSMCDCSLVIRQINAPWPGLVPSFRVSGIATRTPSPKTNVWG